MNKVDELLMMLPVFLKISRAKTIFSTLLLQIIQKFTTEKEINKTFPYLDILIDSSETLHLKASMYHKK